MKRTIQWQLVIAFLLLSFLIIGLIGWATSYSMDVYFQDYIGERQETAIAEYAADLEETYREEEGFDERILQNLTMNAMHQDFSFELYDGADQIIWQSSQGMGHMNHGMHGMVNDNQDGDTIEKTYLLQKGNSTIGKAVFHYAAKADYTEDDQQFIARTKQSFLFVGTAAFLFSIIFAAWVARMFSRPLVHINRFTKKISMGTYQDVLPARTSIVEMNELITSLNDLSSQLERQENMRNQLSRDLAHEIRTPLTTVKGNLEAMIDGIWEPTPERLETCYQEINRMARLIENIEQLNAMESQTLVLHKTSFDLKELSRQVAANFEALAQEKNLTVLVKGESTMICADKDKISQLITNLLANAVKFTPPNGTISLSVKKEKQKARLVVEDNGEGIKAENIARIFDRFYMTESSRNSRIGGQGIGLSIVKSIVNAHGGDIHVDSTVGKGTRFTVEIPDEKRRSLCWQ